MENYQRQNLGGIRLKKIKDRIILGALCGIGGNLAKHLMQRFAMSKKWAEVDGPARAAGILRFIINRTRQSQTKRSSHITGCMDCIIWCAWNNGGYKSVSCKPQHGIE